MSLSPLSPMEVTEYFKMSKIIFFASYVMMSKKRVSRGLTDLTDQYTRLDPYFWVFFLLIISIILLFRRIYTYLFKTGYQANLWTMIRIVVNQSKIVIFLYS